MVATREHVEADTRTRLLASTATLIHAGSYQAVGVRAICEHAGVQRGSFYHFFASKQALVLDTIDEMWKAYVDEVGSCFDSSLPPRERIEALFDHAYRTHSEIREQTGHVLGSPFCNLAAEASTLDEPIRDRVLGIFDEWATLIEEPISAAQVAGELDPTISAEDMSWTLLSALLGALVVAKAANDTTFIPVVGREVVATLWARAAA